MKEQFLAQQAQVSRYDPSFSDMLLDFLSTLAILDVYCVYSSFMKIFSLFVVDLSSKTLYLIHKIEETLFSSHFDLMHSVLTLYVTFHHFTQK